MNGLQETNVYAFSGLSNGEYDNLNTDTINTQELYINNVLFDPSGNNDLSNYVTITELSTQLTPINNNIATNTTDISGLKFKTTNISYNGTLTTFSGNISFPTNSIASASINNSTFVALTGNQSVGGIKTFNSNAIFTQTLRLDNSLLVGTAGNVILTNATLQKIAYLANVTSDINSTFNNYVLTSTLNTTLLNYITSSSLSLTLSNYITSSYLTTQLANYITSSYLTSQLSNYVLSTTLSGYITSTSLNLTLSNYVLTSALNTKLNDYALITSLNTTNSNVTALQNKLQDIYYDVPTQYFDINHNAHIYGVLKLGAILNVEASIDALGVSVGVAGGAAAKATTDILTINNITIPAMNLVSAGLSLRIDNLETKTTNQTFNLALNTTYITGTLSLTTVRLNSLDSGILQTANQSVVFIGETQIRNDFSVTNGFGVSIDGGIVQNNNSQNTFRGGLRVNNTLESNDFTSGGTNTNINSTNCNITGNTIIKNTSTTSSGTIPPYLSILSTKLNTNNRKLQGLVIGKEQLVANEECNVNIGFNYAFGNFENYGYLGLNVNTTDTREAFRWYETGCSLPTGDLTVSEGGIVISSGDIKVNTINNRSTNLNINGSYALNINSNTINIGTNQGIVPPAFNTINIGNVASLSVINLNGLVYTAFPVNITGAISQW